MEVADTSGCCWPAAPREVTLPLLSLKMLPTELTERRLRPPPPAAAEAWACARLFPLEGGGGKDGVEDTTGV